MQVQMRVLMRRGLRRAFSVLLCLALLSATGIVTPARVALASTTWTAATSPLTPELYSAKYAAGLWVVGTGGQIATSPDGITWDTPQTLSGSNFWYGEAYDGSSQWVIVGSGGAIRSSSTPRAGPWPAITVPGLTATDDLWGITYSGTRFVAVGANGTVVYSTGGAWTKTTAGSQQFNGVAYGGGTFVAVGMGGTIYSSADGVSWTSRTSPAGANDLLAVAYAQSKFVAVGAAGTVLTSPDGITWTLQTSVTTITTQILYGVDYGAGKWVAVGNAMTIISSTNGTSWAQETPASPNASDYFDWAHYGGGLWMVGGAHLAGGANGLLETQAVSTNANLGSLTLSQGTLTPAFSSTTTSYTASVANTVSSVNITPTLADATATMTVNGSAATSGSAVSVPLNVGTNTITVVVTAQDTTTTKTYTVTVTRAASSNANLSNLTLSQGTLTPAFASGTTTYTATVANSVSSLNITPTVADSTATLKVNGSAATSGSPSTVSLAVGPNPINVLVTAQDGTTTKTYTVTVTRTAPLAVSTTTLTGADVNVAYSQTLAATGGATPYAWSVTAGTLPTGLSLSSAGVISGTPTVTGTSSFTVQVTDALSQTATKALTLTVAPAPTVTTTLLPDTDVNAAYSQTLAASGGTAPLTWSKTAGTLPTGLNLSAAGVISGTPTATGTASFTVQVSDTYGQTATQALTLTVAAAPAVSTTSLPGADVNVVYTQTLAATGGTAPLTWSVSVGTLPTGLSLNPTTGVLGGTPTATGTFSFTVQVSDSASPSQTATKALTLTVAAAPAVSTTTLTGADMNAPYSQTLAATGGTTPYTWSVTTGTLPTGLSLSSAGVISGTPTAAGTSSFTVQVSDNYGQKATQALTLTVATAPAVSTTTLPGADVNAAYSQTLAASGGTAPLTWSVTVGALPTGLSLNASTGMISGTPTATGTSSFTVQVSDNYGQTATQALTLTVAAAPAVSTTSLPGADVNVTYSQTLAASGGTAPLTWSVAGGSTLPSGLSLNPTTGVLSGTPTAAGTFSFTVQVSDSASPSQTATKALTLTVAATPAVSTTTLTGADVNVPYSQTLAATGGTSPLTWSVTTGTLPTGLSLSSAGVISGTPTATGTSSFTVQISDNYGQKATQALTLAVASAPAVSTTTLAGADVNAAYSQTLAATGGTAPLTWSVTVGTLPTGLSLNAGTGVISGTPTATGTSNFTVQVSDNYGQTATQALTLTVAPAPAVSTTSLPGADANVVYSQTLAATGGTAPLTWSVSAGTLPTGLSLSTGGVINGTPTAAGTFSFTVQVSDSASPSQTATKALTLTVAALPAVTTTALAGADMNVAYSQSLAATGGTAPLTWSVTIGTLPTGLSLSTGGVISGTPTATGTSSFTVQVSDNYGQKATQTLTLMVAPAPAVSTTTLPGADVNAPYSQTLAATGGTAPLTWSVTVGTLPTGLSLNASTGVISGTPTATGPASFTVQVSDNYGQKATQALTLTVAAAPAVSTTSLPGADVSVAYTQTLAATGGTAPLTWSVTTGTLPTGLSLSSAGVISGTPTAAGTFSFTVQVSDSASPSQAATQALTLTVAALPAVSTTTLAGAEVNVAYSQTLAATGGTAPLTWSVTTGTLPTGLSLSTGGLISGTPTAAGTFSFTVQVSDNYSQTATKALSLTVAALPAVSTSTLPGADVNVAYSQTLAATGGTAPLTWSVTVGTLPTGLSLNATTGVLSGTPTATGTSSFTVQVSDNYGQKATQPLALTVAALPTVSTATLPGGEVSVLYSQTLAAAGGTAPLTWSVASGALPTGLSLSTGGVISGTPTANGTANLTVQVTDANNQTAIKALSLTVAALPSVSTTSLLGADANAPYSQPLAATGGTAPLTWSVTSGTLPTGLSLSTGGVISGTPTATGTATFTVQVSDNFGQTASKALSLVVSAAPAVSTTTLPNANVNVAYPAQTLAVSGGTAPFTWSITSGTLPTGLSLNGTTGVITGTPTTTGAFNFTVQVSDNYGKTDSKALSVTVLANVATLSNLTISQGTLVPAFASGTTTYTATVSNGVTAVDVTPTATESHATVTVNGSATTSGSAKTVALTVGNNPINVVVTAQDGTTTKTYTVTVYRAPSGNASLSNLTLSQGTLTPAFTSNITSYTASVDSEIKVVNVTAVTADAAAYVTINGTAVGSGSAVPIDLKVGDNPVSVTVTAQNGATRSHTITITRSASKVADLRSLTINPGTFSPAFSPSVTSYTSTVANTVRSLSVTPTPADAAATVSVNGMATSSDGSALVQLAEGVNTVTISVLAPDHKTSKVYSLSVERETQTNSGGGGNGGWGDTGGGSGTCGGGDTGGKNITEATTVANQSTTLCDIAHGLTLVIPPGSAQTVTVQVQSGATVPPIGSAPNPETRIQSIGKALSVTVHAPHDTTDTTFAQPASLVLTLTPQDLQGVADPQHLGVFLRNPDGSLSYVGGAYANGQLTAHISGSGTYVVANVNVTFNDQQQIPQWATANVNLLAAKFVVAGLPGGNFDPHRVVNRAESAALLVRVLGLPAPHSAATFTDVTSSDWFAQAVATGTSAGILRGYPDGNFQPAKPVSRQEFAVLIGQALLRSGKAQALDANQVQTILAGFGDADAVAPWARQYMALAIQAGIVHGGSGGTLSPESGATRAETVTMLARLWLLLQQ